MTINEFTEAQIVAGARCLADRSAAICNVDREDNWKIYGEDFLQDFRLALEAAQAVKEQK